jgi:hypothetical protein
LAQRSRKRRADAAPRGEGTGPVADAAPRGEGTGPVADAPPRGYARARARDAEARVRLRPLAPGERPRAVTVAAAVAALLAAANLGLWAAGWSPGDDTPPAIQVVVFSAVMVAAAVFMWRGRYFAVLAFEALLGLSIVWAALGLLVASNLEAVALSLAVIVLGGALFWALIRAMARLQLTERLRRGSPPPAVG